MTSNDQFITNLRRASRIDDMRRVGASKVLAITDPLKYENEYQEMLKKVDSDMTNYAKAQLSAYANTGLSQEAIQDAVARETMTHFQTSMYIFNQQFPFRNLANIQALENKKSRIITRRAAPAKKRASARKRTTRKKTTKK